MDYYKSLILRIAIPFIISYEILQKIIFYLTINITILSLNIINKDVFLIDDSISYNGLFVKLIPACAAASAYYLLLLLVCFTKDIGLNKRLKIFFYGSLIIFIINTIRIIFLIIVLDKHSYNLFKTIHLFFWSVIASILVAGIWIYFIKRYKIRSIPIYSDLKYLLKRIIKHIH